MIIAIDFDGTIAEHPDPGKKIGPPLPGAIEAVKHLGKIHTLILWTCRGGDWLEDAVLWLLEHGIVFDKVNENVRPLSDGITEEYWPRKVFAHYYIDDRVVGGFPGWEAIMEQLP